MLLNDTAIVDLIVNNDMISPVPEKDFVTENQDIGGVISYGVSSFGYDMRVDNEFLVMDKEKNPEGIVDPKDFWDSLVRKETVLVQGDRFLIPPHGFALAKSVEYFKIPEDIMCLCVGKSTYARCGIIVNVTPLEPGWEGFVTIEISNTTPFPAAIYPGEGISQILFFKGFKPLVTYGDRRGKYQHQQDITLPKV